MKYALINNEKVEATKGAKGSCFFCGLELVAKCGDVKRHHWAHKRLSDCDPWWENETDWHRSWKNNFPKEWQETILIDVQTGEKHIADIRTAHGLVLEFQHSHMNPEERVSREKFYKNMVWVVDGTLLKKDYTRFLKGATDFRNSDDPQIFYFDVYGECFPSKWLESPVPVIFDFKGTKTVGDPADHKSYIYCLQPNINSKYALLARLSHQQFIDNTISGGWPSLVRSFFNRLNVYTQLQQAYAIQNAPVNMASPNVFDRGEYKRRYRF